jgi:hypothetical protein
MCQKISLATAFEKMISDKCSDIAGIDFCNSPGFPGGENLLRQKNSLDFIFSCDKQRAQK